MKSIDPLCITARQCVEMPRDYHVINVIVVMQGAFQLRDFSVEDLVINKAVLNASTLTKRYRQITDGQEIQQDASQFKVARVLMYHENEKCR